VLDGQGIPGLGHGVNLLAAPAERAADYVP
jgi:hypothetical protein